MLVLLLGTVVAAHAGPADLDPTFGTNGVVTVPFGGLNGEANAVLVQPDGMIVAAGDTGGDVALARCDPDGSLDASFGSGGIVTTDFGGTDAAYAMVRQPDGMLVIAGTGSSPAALVLARYADDGTLDPGFGVGGRVVTAGMVGSALVLQPDGKLVAGGSGMHGFMLVRYLSDGTIDGGFGSGGVASTDFPLSSTGLPTTLSALVLQADGALVAAGGGGDDYALARFDSGGILDPTFGSGGQVATDGRIGLISFPTVRAAGVAIDPDGKITIAGSSSGAIFVPNFPPQPASVAVIGRYGADGTLDNGFGSSGFASLNSLFQSLATANAVVVQSDEKPVAAGVEQMSSAQHLLARRTTTGAQDPSFASSGTRPTGTSNALTEQSDHRLVAAGFIGTTGTHAFAILRYQGGECGDGIVDPFEGCDDGNLTSGDGCDANCTPTGCGNGIVTAGEDCDPPGSGNCCTSACTFATAGTACTANDDLCANHTCDGSGGCQHAEGPSPICVAAAPRGSKLAIRNAFTDRRTITWSWKGPGVVLGDVADPTTTPYALCVYDHTPDPVTTLVQPLPAPPFCVGCWRAAPMGFDYKERTASYAGVQRVVLHVATKGGTFKLKAKGPASPAPSALPMSVDPTVSVQLRNADGACWGAELSAPTKNDSATFKAKSD